VSVRLFCAGLVLLCAAPGAVSACQGKGNPLLDDYFKNADPGWGRADSIAAFTANGLILRPPVQGSAWRWNQGYSMAHADLCIDVTNPSRLPMYSDEDALGAVGLWFWGKDSQNFYTATITLDGKASIDRLADGKWHEVVAPVTAPAVKTTPNAVNELEIVTAGKSAKFFVNAVMISEFAGDPPADGGAPGIYGESGPSETSWTFSRVRLY
jgi:hypothetical protein